MLSCFSHVWLFETLWTIALQAPPSMGLSRQEYWSRLPFSPPGDLPWPRDQTRVSKSPALQAGSLPLGPPGKPLVANLWGQRILYYKGCPVHYSICTIIPGFYPLDTSSPHSHSPSSVGTTKNTSAAAAKSLQSCPTLCDPIDGSPPGSPVPGILQARTLEWVAISFSNPWKWKGSRSVVSDS